MPFCCDIYGHVEVSVRLLTVAIAMLFIFAIALNTSTVVPDEGFRRDGAKHGRGRYPTRGGAVSQLEGNHQTCSLYQLLRGRVSDFLDSRII